MADTDSRTTIDQAWVVEMENRISDAIAASQRARGKCDADGDPCGADCACLAMVRAELEGRIS